MIGDLYMENRNRFHNYDDLEKIDLISQRYWRDIENGQLSLPNKEGEPFYLDKFTFYNLYRPYYTFNVSLTKEDYDKKKILNVPSKIWDGEIKFVDTYEKVKLKKDGTPYKRRKNSPSYDEKNKRWVYKICKGNMYTPSYDIQSYWEYYKEYRQISSGLNHIERRVIVGDFDIPFTDNTIKELEDKCTKYNIPHFTYLEKHLDSKHYQIGWVLDCPFYKKNYSDNYRYPTMYRHLTEIFGSDKNCKNWNIKNPNCIHLTETYWYNDVVSKTELYNSVELTYTKYFYKRKETEDLNLTDLWSTEIETSAAQTKIKKYITNETSRNVELFNELRSWYREYLQTNGQHPSYVDLHKKGMEISSVLGKLTHKGIEETNKINSTIHSIQNYFQTKGIKGTYTTNQQYGNLRIGSRKEEKLIDVYLLYKKGYGEKKIYTDLNLKRSSVSKYLRYIRNNETLFQNKDYEKVIPMTMELYKTTKSISHKNDCKRIMNKLDTDNQQ